MKKRKIIKRRNIQAFKSYLIFLEAHNDRNELLHETAEFLLENKSLTKREKAFKHHFFALYALELAGACGCSEVLPDHLRIDNQTIGQDTELHPLFGIQHGWHGKSTEGSPSGL